MLSPRQSTPSQTNYVDDFKYVVSKKASVSINPADVYLDYIGDGALFAPKLVKIMSNNGLDEEKKTVDLAWSGKAYSNSKATCIIGYTSFWARLWCVATPALNESKDGVTEVLEAATKQLGSPVPKDEYRISYMQSTDATIKAVVYGDSRDGSVLYFVSENGNWKYLSRSKFTTIAGRESVLVDCKLLSSTQYKDAFIDYISSPANCR